MSLLNHSIKELEDKLHNQEITAEDLVNASIDRIKEVDDEIQAFLALDEEQAKERAKQLDSEEKKGKLSGLPFGVKDNIVTKDLRTTAGSQLLKNFDHPLYDATVIEKLEKAQAINVGKLNLDEFAMGGTNENSSFAQTRNPWNSDHVPGGSSGGSAAAVATGEVQFSLGTDSGGSIRQPASYCGIVGMKPTYGRVSRFGLIAFAPSLDQIGPMTRTVEDNARVLEVIAGQDMRDATSSPTEVPEYTEALTGDVKGLKIGVPKEYLGEGVDQEVKDAVKKALEVYEKLGATWEEVSLPHSEYAQAAYYLVSSAEASSSLARYDGVRFGVRSENAKDMEDMYKLSRSEGFGEEVKRRVMLGTYALSAGNYEDYFVKAQKVRTLIKQDFEKVFEDYDVIIGPTTATAALKFGEEVNDPRAMKMSDTLITPVNLAGVPAISIPCGFSKEGLPLGLQIIGKYFDEETVYRAAHAYEQATDHHTKRPQLGGGQ